MQKNIQLIYSLPPHSSFSRAFVRQCLKHQAACLVETMRAIVDPNALTLEGYETFAKQVQSLAQPQRGVIIVTGHLGSWEFCGHLITMTLGNVYAVAKPSRSKLFNRCLEELRKRMRVKLIFTDHPNLFQRMEEVLQNGEHIGLVADQKPRGKLKHTVDFLGQPTDFAGGAALLSLRTGAPIISLFCIRTRAWHYRVFSRHLTVPEGQNVDIVSLTQVVAHEMSHMVSLYPEQWTWDYRRWKQAFQ